jgi:hypothetical protein
MTRRVPGCAIALWHKKREVTTARLGHSMTSRCSLLIEHYKKIMLESLAIAEGLSYHRDVSSQP